MAGRQMIFVYERDQRQNICCFVLTVTMVERRDLVFNFTPGILPSNSHYYCPALLWMIVFPLTGLISAPPAEDNHTDADSKHRKMENKIIKTFAFR